MPLIKEGTYTYTPISTNTTTLVKSGAGRLHTITINTKGASANTVTVYNALTATGTPIATIDSTVTYGTLIYDCQFSTGLCIVTATGTCADMTVCYE